MKKLTLLLSYFLALLLAISTSAQTGWQWQNPLPQGNRLNAVSMRGTHWAVGDNGTVIHRIMPGDYWVIVDIGTTENLNDIDIYSISQQGWIVGDKGTIYYTENNGATWVKQNSGTTNDLYSVSAVNDACVWVCGENGTVLKSLYDNSGNWENVSPFYQLNLYSIDNYHCNEAWAVGEDGLIIHTTNGGQNWTSVNSGTSWDLYDVDMSENGMSRVCGRSGIILSKDWDEDTWHKENESLEFWLNGITTKIGFTGYAVGYDGVILRGTDGGATWTQLDSGVPWELTDITSIALEDDTYQVVGQFGIMLRNSGFNTDFEVVNDMYWHMLADVEFANADTGWAAGGDPGWTGSPSGAVLRTTDGGETWNVMQSFPINILDMDFVDENEGWIVGREGLIRHTVNGGNNWYTQTSPLTGTFTSVSFVDADNGWIVSASNWGEILHTTNGGNTWTVQDNPSNKALHDVFFIDENTGWATGIEAALIKTTDGGNTWHQINVNAAQNYRFASVYFVDESHGWLAGIYGSIVRTTDGGNTWTQVESGTGESFEDIFFINTQIGWAVGDQGTVVHSTDGGLTWHSQVSGVASNFLASVYFLNETTGWVAGEGGTILFTQSGGSNMTNTIHVDIENDTGIEDGTPEHPYNTVFEGIDAAIAGDSVIIHPGLYEEAPLENLPIKDGLIIAGMDSASTIINIPFSNADATMKYHTEFSGLTCPGYRFACGDGMATIVIRECHTGEISFATGSGYNFIVKDCTIEGLVGNSSQSNYLTVMNNTFLNGGINDSGLAPEGVEAHIFSGNTFISYFDKREDSPVIDSKATSGTFTNNTITVYGPGSGITLRSGSPTNVSGNTIVLNDGIPMEGTTGIYTNAGEGVVTGNNITGGWVGYYSQSGATLFENNTITKARTGFISAGNEKVNNNTITQCSGNGLISNGMTGPIQNNTITSNDSAGVVLNYPVDLGGGPLGGDGRNTLQNNGYYDLWVKYSPAEPDTLHARYNLWDHNNIDDIL
ncbi:MAG TPA: YCF48-related protein, partial [Bacteroidales bacterium]